MNMTILPLPGALSALFSQACSTKELTLADRYGLMAVLLLSEVDEDDLRCIDRLLYAVRRGRVKVSEKISSVL
jgi:hypothetical protein